MRIRDRLLLSIVAHVQSRRLILLTVQFDFLAFGSWRVEAGTSHRRVRIARDGKEGLLRPAIARTRVTTESPRWEEGPRVPIPVEKNDERALAIDLFDRSLEQMT